MSESAALKTLIVDDEPLAVERLQILCAKIPGLQLMGTAADGTAALRLAAVLEPDLLLLDIQMPQLDGMAVARTLSEKGKKPAVIFVTAFDAFAVDAFEVAAVDYLLKPITADRLERAVARVREQMERLTSPQALGSVDGAPTSGAQSRSAWTQEFWVPHRSEIVRIAVCEIDLIDAERDYMRLHVGDRSYLLHQTISELERKLDPSQFVRLHRSTMTQRNRIVGFKHLGAGAWEAQLRDGRMVRVGRTYLANVRAMAGRE